MYTHIIDVGTITLNACSSLASWHHCWLTFWWHDDVIKWNHYPRYWPFVRGIHRSLVNSLHKGQWRGALMFSLICVWINGCANNREAGDLRRHRVNYDVIVMSVCMAVTNGIAVTLWTKKPLCPAVHCSIHIGLWECSSVVRWSYCVLCYMGFNYFRGGLCNNIVNVKPCNILWRNTENVNHDV